MTAALEELTARGHSLDKLIDGYPVGLVQNLYRACQENKRRDLILRTIGLAAAMNNAIDLAFGGKGKILGTWIETLENAGRPETESRSAISSRARGIFQGLPVKKG